MCLYRVKASKTTDRWWILTGGLKRRGDIGRSLGLERKLCRVRWFGISLGVALVAGTERIAGTQVHLPGHVRPSASAILVALAVTNILVCWRLRDPITQEGLRRLGVGAFIADASALFGLAWVFTFAEASDVWVLPYILVLEGALRYRMAGALIPVGAALVIEAARELWRSEVYGNLFDPELLFFRVGIMAIVAFVAGMMARQLSEEREQAEEHARELQAFQDIVLAGARGRTVVETIGEIANAMAGVLSYETLGIGLVEAGTGGTVVRLVGGYGFPAAVIGRSVRVGEGIVGRTVETGLPQLIADTSREASYVEFVPRARAEMCVPIHAHGHLIGVIDVESPRVGRFDQHDLDRLRRLAPQIGLIISNSQLFEHERSAVERLRELDTMKTDFVAIASHELRTPLTTISGYIKTLRRPDFNPSGDELAEYHAAMDRRTDRLIRLVEDLLVVSHLDRETLDVVPESTEVAGLLAEVCADIGPAAEHVRVRLHEATPPLQTDPARLGQILRNLIENALKVTDATQEVTVAVRREQRWLFFEIADRGPGIERDELERIFDRFHQVGGSMRRRGPGVGLGLYIAKRLAEGLGGNVGVRSAPGEGATFWVRVPFAAVEETREKRSS